MNTGGAQSVTRALETLEHALHALHADAQCEVFQRSTRRLSIELEQGRVRVRHGVEEGTSVRLRAADGSVHFGAASGVGESAAREARAAALAHAGVVARGDPWAGAGRLLDVEAPAELPEREVLEGWLRDAADGVRACLDAAVGVEVLGTGGGLRTCRVRPVFWARQLEGTRVRSAVSRSLEHLDPADWEEPERVPPRERWHLEGDVALLPAAVGALAPALVAAVPVGAAAGPGWACVDDPQDPYAPGGGAFDDTGFPAERLRLADGRRVLAQPRGPGRRRRHSFREPPAERAASLEFLPLGVWSGHGLLARGARIHTVGSEWWVVLDAAPAEKGHPVGPWEPHLVRAHPEKWVSGCEAVVPPVRRTPEGVLSGTLVFGAFHLRHVPL